MRCWIARRGSLISAAALVTILHAATVHAQPAGQTIPVELATAYVRTLARADSAANVEFLPGEVPAAMHDIIPAFPGARILGSVVVGRATTVVGTATVSPDSVLAWYAATYTKRGIPGMALLRLQTSPLCVRRRGGRTSGFGSASARCSAVSFRPLRCALRRRPIYRSRSCTTRQTRERDRNVSSIPRVNRRRHNCTPPSRRIRCCGTTAGNSRRADGRRHQPCPRASSASGRAATRPGRWRPPSSRWASRPAPPTAGMRLSR